MSQIPRWDCLIAGAGPAGLTAAVYLGRFLRRVLVLHNGASRAALIPTSHNFPGFSQGISGIEFLKELRRQAGTYGAVIEQEEVLRLAKDAHGFTAVATSREIKAASIILATGVVDATPPIVGLRGSIFDGQVRYCPICDGFEAIDKNIAVVGPFNTALRKALFLRTYSSRLTVVVPDAPSDAESDELVESGIRFEHGEIARVRRENHVVVDLKDGRALTFDILYPAMGCTIRSKLAVAIGASVDEDGALLVDTEQQTSIKGLYAIGDVISCLDQMSVGVGHAAIAATAVHNGLPRNFRSTAS